eukprot:TRINITY_DN3005_c0_g1_i1.p1 TRINITY_DN3005_c0_g1~~TRINITY_DN3005_c0_g1_i1.p1  ORF type:complete len:471 (-),score=118.48 TRINITY_DN3005_c0_g1_i1:61-1473(-)
MEPKAATAAAEGPAAESARVSFSEAPPVEFAIDNFSSSGDQLWHERYRLECDICQAVIDPKAPWQIGGAPTKSGMTQHQLRCAACVTEAVFAEIGHWLVGTLAGSYESAVNLGLTRPFHRVASKTAFASSSSSSSSAPPAAAAAKAASAPATAAKSAPAKPPLGLSAELGFSGGVAADAAENHTELRALLSRLRQASDRAGEMHRFGSLEGASAAGRKQRATLCDRATLGARHMDSVPLRGTSPDAVASALASRAPARAASASASASAPPAKKAAKAAAEEEADAPRNTRKRAKAAVKEEEKKVEKHSLRRWARGDAGKKAVQPRWGLHADDERKVKQEKGVKRSKEEKLWLRFRGRGNCQWWEARVWGQTRCFNVKTYKTDGVTMAAAKKQARQVALEWSKQTACIRRSGYDNHLLPRHVEERESAREEKKRSLLSEFRRCRVVKGKLKMVGSGVKMEVKEEDTKVKRE